MTNTKKNRPIGENQRDSGVTGLIQQLYDRGYADAEEDFLNKGSLSYGAAWGVGINIRISQLETRLSEVEQQLRKQDD